MFPSLSVVMPTLNQASFIAAAIDSVLGDADGADELVVMDGGSTDGTAEIVSQRQAVYGPRLRWYSKPDRGPAQAVNRAVGQAGGEWIGWLNSDDLYAPGAVARLRQALLAQPEWVMVYGEGEHVDVDGGSLGRYPTLPPDTPLERFRDGCFICQPTAFFRRSVFQELGGLDESLKASFDFEFWLRLFKAHPQGIGFVPQLQARSRLHEGGITLRQRERVALEGMELLHRHLGWAPPHWLLTHLEERWSQAWASPAWPEAPLAEVFAALARRVSGWLSAQGRAELSRRLAEDARLRLSGPELLVGVYADGWAPPRLELRVKLPQPQPRWLLLQGRHAHPRGSALTLSVGCGIGRVVAERIWRMEVPGPFEIRLPVADLAAQAASLPASVPVGWTLRAEEVFVPAEVERGSTDRRSLSFRVESLRWVR